MPHRLLLADDSVTIQRVIELTFAEEGVDVVSVGDGEAAIARLGSERFDIVLADIGMPGRDGFDVAAFVRSKPDLSGVPVVLLTGALDPLDQGRVAQSGAAAERWIAPRPPPTGRAEPGPVPLSAHRSVNRPSPPVSLASRRPPSPRPQRASCRSRFCSRSAEITAAKSEGSEVSSAGAGMLRANWAMEQPPIVPWRLRS